MGRPLGVTILAVLQILMAIGLLIVSLGMFALAALSGAAEIEQQLGTELPEWLLDVAATFFAVLGVVFLIFAIIGFAIAYGFLKGRVWAWGIGIALAIISILLNVIPPLLTGSWELLVDVGTIFSVLIALLIILYLTRPHVRQFFGQAGTQPGGSLPPMMH